MACDNRELRSIAEIRFRLRQEVANARLLLLPPSLPDGVRCSGGLALPAPDSFIPRLRDTEFAREIEKLAEAVCAHRFPLLGYSVDAGEQIRWRRDYVHGVETETPYFRRIPYLDPSRAG